MDPNANLAEQRELVRAILADEANNDDAGYRLAELVEALDEWLSRGGFLPDDWRKGR